MATCVLQVISLVPTSRWGSLHQSFERIIVSHSNLHTQSGNPLLPLRTQEQSKPIPDSMPRSFAQNKGQHLKFKLRRLLICGITKISATLEARETMNARIQCSAFISTKRGRWHLGRVDGLLGMRVHSFGCCAPLTLYQWDHGSWHHV